MSEPGTGSDTAFGTPPPKTVANTLTAEAYFLDSLNWLALAYRDTPFWTERDIVYVLQRRLSEGLQRSDGTWRVFNGHRINPGEKPAVSADLVMVSPAGEVSLGAQFKYEPCHRRPDIAKTKFPVAVWTDVVKDAVRAGQMVERGVEVAYAICIDEGGWTTTRDRSMFERHLQWDTDCPCGRDHAVDVLMHRVAASQAALLRLSDACEPRFVSSRPPDPDFGFTSSVAASPAHQNA